MSILDDERRAQPRNRPQPLVAVDYPEQRLKVRDLNLLGAYIEDPTPPASGRVRQIRLWLDETTGITMKAMIRRSEPGAGMAVEFVEMTSAARRRLESYVESVARARNRSGTG